MVQIGMGKGFVCFIWPLEHTLTRNPFNSYPFAVGLLFDEAEVLKVPENPVVSMADSYRPLR